MHECTMQLKVKLRQSHKRSHVSENQTRTVPSCEADAKPVDGDGNAASELTVFTCPEMEHLSIKSPFIIEYQIKEFRFQTHGISPTVMQVAGFPSLQFIAKVAQIYNLLSISFSVMLISLPVLFLCIFKFISFKSKN